MKAICEECFFCFKPKGVELMKRLPIVFLLGIALVVSGLVSCEKEVEKIVEAPAAITVTSVSATADSVTQGQTVQLWAAVEMADSISSANLQYSWYADKGSFAVSSGDTAVWTSPGETGVVKITVHVTDGENIAIGMKNVGVDTYVPTADVYYVGAEVCANCHSSEARPQYTNWSETAHAHAWATLQASDHAASYCEPCHTVQQNDTPGNSGFDEVPTAQFEDVQCESCHGPGSAHAESGDASKVVNGRLAALDVSTCGVCHNGEHHPYLEEWEESRHSQLTENHGASIGSCQPCHSGTGFVDAFSGSDEELYSSDNPMELTCGACHDSHSDENPGQLRTVAPVTLATGVVADAGGAGQLCMQCHHARHTAEEQVPEGDAHFGPHHSNQADAVYGTTGNKAVNPDMTFASSGHGLIEDACARCHVYPTAFDEVTGTANVGHTFEPRVEACVQCHGEVDGFDAIMAKKDYDNDGEVEGLQVEVEGLMQKLAEVMVEYDNANYGSKYLGNPDPTSEDFVSTVMDSVGATVNDSTEAGAVMIREGGFNLVYEFEERSHGVHNPAYVVQLLQQSILFYDDAALPGDVILRDNHATTFTTVASAEVVR